MDSNAAVVTCAYIAPGVIVFAWVDGTDRGDGVLVDADVASARWCEVADVLLRSSGGWSARRPEISPVSLAYIVDRYRALLAGHDEADDDARDHDVASNDARDRMRSARGSSATA